MYLPKEECFRYALAFLRSGWISEKELNRLIDFYLEHEHYECCQGILEAWHIVFDEKKQDERITDYNT